VAGASGLVGTRLLRYLLADSGCGRVVALGRRPLPVLHPKLEARLVDFAALPALAADAAFCCLGTTMRAAGSREAFRRVDHDHVVAFAAAARAGNASRFLLVSSVGADAGARNFYLRVKGEAEQAVAALGFAGLDILRPGLMLGPRPERRPTEALAQRLLPLVNPLLPSRYRAIDHDVVARAMAAALHLPPTPGRIHHYAEMRRPASP